MSNQNFSVATDNSLKPISATTYQVQFKAYRGDTALTAVTGTPTNKQFKVVAPSAPTGFKTPTVSVSGGTATLTFEPTGITTVIGANATVDVTVQYEGTTVTETKLITISASKQGATGATGNYTIRVPLYYVSTSTTAPAKPTDQITATAAATTTTWTKGKYTSYAVGKYYYTCEQIETYNASGTYLFSAWSTPVRDIEYENASTAKLRASGKYIGKKGATFGYTASSNWDWFLATASFSLSGLSGNTVAGNVYIWNGASWTKDTDTSHLAASMNDMIGLIDTYTNDSTSIGAFATVFAQTLATAAAFITKLFGEEIIVGNYIKSENYSNSDGFIIKSDGTAEFNKGRFRAGLGDVIKAFTYTANTTVNFDYTAASVIERVTLYFVPSDNSYASILATGNFIKNNSGQSRFYGNVFAQHLFVSTNSTKTRFSFRNYGYSGEVYLIRENIKA